MLFLFRRKVVLDVERLADFLGGLTLDHISNRLATKIQQGLDVQKVGSENEAKERLLGKLADELGIPRRNVIGTTFGLFVRFGGDSWVIFVIFAVFDDTFESCRIDVGQGDRTLGTGKIFDHVLQGHRLFGDRECYGIDLMVAGFELYGGHVLLLCCYCYTLSSCCAFMSNKFRIDHKKSVVDVVIESMDIPKFSFAGVYKDVPVTKIVDGDTIQLAIPFAIPPLCKKVQPFLFNVRLKGINCPETRTKNCDEKQRGLAAKEFASGLLSGKKVTFDCQGQDKYGRLLGKIIVDGVDASLAILEAGHAVKFMDD